MRSPPSLCLLVGCISLMWTCSQSAVAAAQEAISFREKIAPILIENCVACHGAKKAEGGYRVDSFAALTRAGDSGLAPLTAGNVEQSELLRRMHTDVIEERMPAEADPLPAPVIELVKQWVIQGGNFDGGKPEQDLTFVAPPTTYPAPPEVYRGRVPITAITLSPDGSQVIAAGYHELTVWSCADGSLVRRISNISERVHSISFHPGGEVVAVSGGEPGKIGETRLIRWSNGELLEVISRSTDIILDAQWRPDGKRIATSGADGLIRVYDYSTPSNEFRTIASHADWVFAIAWSPDGSKLASASRDKTSKVFDVETGDLLATYTGHGQAVKGVAFHPDGAEVYSAGSDNKLLRWKVADLAKTVDRPLGGEGFKLTVAGDALFSTSSDRNVREFEIKGGGETRVLSAHKDWVLCTSFHAAAGLVASGSFDGEIALWKRSDGTVIKKWIAAPGLATTTAAQ